MVPQLASYRLTHYFLQKQKSLIDPLLTISFFIKSTRPCSCSCNSQQPRFSSLLLPPVPWPTCRSSIVCYFQLFSCPSVDVVPQPPSSEARLTPSWRPPTSMSTWSLLFSRTVPIFHARATSRISSTLRAGQPSVLLQVSRRPSKLKA